MNTQHFVTRSRCLLSRSTRISLRFTTLALQLIIAQQSKIILITAIFYIFSESYTLAFTYYGLSQRVFSVFHSELMRLGKLKEVPLRALDYAAIISPIDVMLKSPIGIDHSHTRICPHETWGLQYLAGNERNPVDEVEGWSIRLGRFYHNEPGDDEDANYHPRFNIAVYEEPHEFCFSKGYVWITCKRCLRRLAGHFRDRPDEVASVFVDATGLCTVEVLIVDEGDERLVWTYRFFHSGVPRCG